MNKGLRCFIKKHLRDLESVRLMEMNQPSWAMAQLVLESGLNNDELTKRTGLSKRTITRIVTGTANPSLKTLRRLARGTGTVLTIHFVEPRNNGR